MIALFGRRAKGRQAVPARPRTTKPRIEELEDRWVPSTVGVDTSQITPPVVTSMTIPTIAVSPADGSVALQTTSSTTPPSTTGTTTVTLSPQTSALLMELLQSLSSLWAGNCSTTSSNPPATTTPSTPTVGSLSGTVYQDANQNGTMDSGDTGISGVTITLTGNNVNQTATTDSNGAYQFSNLPAGSYTITETPPSGFDPGTDNVGSLGGSVSGNSFTVTLPSGGNGTSYNFGEVVPPPPPPATGSLSGFVYQDNNQNGIKDNGDGGVGGVTVALTGNNMNLTTTTDSSGAYQFGNLPTGTYSITETPPSSLNPGTNNIGSLGGSVSGNTFTVALPAGGNGTDYNFGETVPPTNIPVIPSTASSSTTTTQDTCSQAEMRVTLLLAFQLTLPVCDMPACPPPTTPPPTTPPNDVPTPVPPSTNDTPPTPAPAPAPPSDPGSPPASPPALSKRDFIGNAWKSMV
jgi:hypothetical protein